MKTRGLILPVVLAAVALPQTARADAVAPLIPRIKPERADEILVRFHDALAQGAKQGGSKVISASTVRQKLGTPLSAKACAFASCANAQVPALKAKQGLGANIEIVGKNYKITVKMLPSGPSKTARCDICTLAEAVASTRRLAKSVTKSTTPKAAKATKTSTPSKTAKTTSKSAKPASKTNPALGSPGEDKLRKTDGGQQWPLWPAIAAAGVGVAGLAIGIPLISLNGDWTNCEGEPRADGRNCRDQYSTSGVGWTFTSMGIAGLATSGVFFYLYFTSDKRKMTSHRSVDQLRRRAAGSIILRSVQVSPMRGGLYLGAGGRF
jgi:hypothetical protein